MFDAFGEFRSTRAAGFIPATRAHFFPSRDRKGVGRAMFDAFGEFRSTRARSLTVVARIVTARIIASLIGAVRIRRGGRLATQHSDSQQTCVVRAQLIERQVTRRLRGPAFARRQQRAQPAIGAAIRGIDEDTEIRGVDEREPGADDELNAGLPGGDMGPDDAGERVRVRDGDGPISQLRRPDHELIGMAGARQEREIGRDSEFGVGNRGERGAPAQQLAAGRVFANLGIGRIGHGASPIRILSCLVFVR